MSRKLLQQSLDALNLIFKSTPPYKENGECTLTDAASKLCCETIDALEAELAKQDATFIGEGSKNNYLIITYVCSTM